MGSVAGGYATIGHDVPGGCPMNDPERNPAGFLGAELRRARVAAGYSSQEALAARLGYDRSVIAKAETGERPPSPEVADAIEAELFPAGPSGLVGTAGNSSASIASATSGLGGRSPVSALAMTLRS
jgi:DNA-binding XRE family transcriptional regulator